MKKRLFFGIACILVCLLILSCDLFNPDDDKEQREYFPVFEVEAATNYDLGFAIGERFAEEIQAFMTNEAELMLVLGQIISIDSVYFYENLLNKVNDLYPEYLEEMQGTADGSGVELSTLMTVNFFGDILALYYGSIFYDGSQISTSLVGCSTVSYNYDGNQYLAHNEDSFASLHNLMSVVKVNLTGKPEFINFYYPGLICGVAPSMTDAGMAFSNNFIQGAAGNPNGVPHFFVFRSLLEAENVDEAVSILENTLTCNAFHINIASGIENRVVSVEKADNTACVYEVEGLYAHTNHFIQNMMLGFPTVDEESSFTRYDILQADIAAYQDQLQNVDCDVLLDFVCDVAAVPDTTGGATSGMTVGTSIFNMETEKWELYFNDPNDGLHQKLKF